MRLTSVQEPGAFHTKCLFDQAAIRPKGFDDVRASPPRTTVRKYSKISKPKKQLKPNRETQLFRICMSVETCVHSQLLFRA